MVSTMLGVEDLDEGVVITYQRIVPILVVLGVVGSAGSIVVLIRPGLLNANGNKYFLALSWCDLFLSISYITIAVTACGCVFESYASAWFFAHFGWAITCTFHALGTYIIIFMSLDRFVAVWFPVWFKAMTQPPFNLMNRLMFAALLCFGLHVPYMVDAEVQCVAQGTSNDNCTVAVHLLDNCTSNIYISNDGFQKSFDKRWHIVYRYIYNLLVRWLPYALLTILNFSLVLAVVTGKVKFPGGKEKEKVENRAAQEEKEMKRHQKQSKKERVLVVTAIAMTASYVVMTLPITIFLTSYAEASKCRCEVPSGVETLRHVGNIFQLLEHVLHGIYLFLINPRFRQELLYLLQCQKSPNDGFLSDEGSSSNRGRPLSRVSRSSGKSYRDSMPHVQHSRLSCDETVVEHTSKAYKPLRSEILEETLEESNSLCSDTVEETPEKSKSLRSETLEKTSEKSISPCSETLERTSEKFISLRNETLEKTSAKSISLRNDTVEETLEESKSLYNDTVEETSEEFKSLCSDTLEETLEESKSLCSDTPEEEATEELLTWEHCSLRPSFNAFLAPPPGPGNPWPHTPV